MNIKSRIKQVIALLCIVITVFNITPNCVWADDTVSDNSVSDDYASDDFVDTNDENNNTENNDEEKETYIVSFDSDGGEIIDSQAVKAGEFVTKPNDPTKDGFTFDCWKNSDNEWDFENDTVSSDITLIASYTENNIDNSVSDNETSVSLNDIQNVVDTEADVIEHDKEVGENLEELETSSPSLPTSVSDNSISDNSVSDNATTLKALQTKKSLKKGALKSTGGETKAYLNYSMNEITKGAGQFDANTTIKSFRRTDEAFTSETTVSTLDSPYPIYWRITDDGVLELYTEADTIEINGIHGGYLFSYMKGLESVDFTGFGGSPTKTYCMFYQCSSLRSVDLSNFNLSSVTDMAFMFNGCENIEEITADFSGANVTYVHSSFYGCKKLKALNLSGLSTSNAEEMENIFANCESLESLDISSFDTCSATDIHGMFFNCKALRTINMDNWDTSKVHDFSYLFYYCESLTSLDINSWDTRQSHKFTSTFCGCSGLTSLNLSNWRAPIAFNYDFTFYGCSNLVTLDISGWDTPEAISMIGMFEGCKKLKTVDVSSFKTGKVTTFENMFRLCNELESIDVSGFDTKNAESFNCMFEGVPAATLAVENFNTSKVTNMRAVFWNCKNIKSLDLSKWDTSNVTTMQGMFNWMTACQSINFGDNFDMSKVTDIQKMFYNCSSLKNIDLSNTTATKLTNVTGAFQYTGCELIDISGFDFTTATDAYDNIFANSNSLDYIYLGKTSVAINFPTTAYGFGIDDNNDCMIDDTNSYNKSIVDSQPHLYRDIYKVKFESTNYSTPIEKEYLVTRNCHPFIPDDLMSDDDKSHASYARFENNSNIRSWDSTKYMSDYTKYPTGSSQPYISVDIIWDDQADVRFTYRYQYKYSQSINADGSVNSTREGMNDYPSSRNYAGPYAVRLNKPIPQALWDKINSECAKYGEFNNPENFNGWYQVSSNDITAYKNPVKKWETDDIITLDDLLPSSTNNKGILYLDAKFDNNIITIVPDRNDFSKNIEIEVGYGDTVDLSSINLTKDGYEFNGWKQYDPNYYGYILLDYQLIEFDPSTPITDSAYIYADWKSLDVFTIRFHFMSGYDDERIVPVDVYEDDIITLSKNVQTNKFNNHIFDGWYTSDNQKIDLNTYTADGSIEDLYAMYNVRVSWNNTADAYWSSSTYDYNTTISEVKEPRERDHATFVKWTYTTDPWYPSLGYTAETGDFDPEMLLTCDIDLNPVYEYEAGYGDGSSFTPDAVTPIEIHEMLKEGDTYVEKSVKNISLYNDYAEMFSASEFNLYDNAMPDSDHEMTYLSAIYMVLTSMSGYTPNIPGEFIGLSSTADGPATTWKLSDDRVIYLYYEEFEDNGKVAVLDTGLVFNTKIAQLLDDDSSITRVYSIDDIDMENCEVLSTYYSKYPIYASYADDTNSVNIYTEASTIEFNENSSCMFLGLKVNTNLGRIDTSKVKNMSFMFANSYIGPQHLSNFDTSSATNMAGMFMGSPYPVIGTAGFDTSNVTNMGLMFAFCNGAANINVSGLNTSKVTNMGGMFALCEHLESIDLSSFDTSNVVNMEKMFYGSNITTFDLSNFNTSKVENMKDMFMTQSAITMLDISGFTFESIPNADAMKYWVTTATVIKMGKVESGKTIPFVIAAYRIDDDDDGIPESSLMYSKAVDDNTKHIYKALVRVRFYDGDLLYDEQYGATRFDIIKPEDPTKSGMKFVGWTLDNGDLVNFADPSFSSMDVCVYARWVPDAVQTDECKVTYCDSTFFSKYNAKEIWVKRGTKLTPMNTPIETLANTEDFTKDPTFIGWITDDGTLWDFENDVVTEDIILYPLFDPVLVEVVYLYNEGDKYSINYIAVPYNEVITQDLTCNGMYEINEISWLGPHTKTTTIYSSYAEFQQSETTDEIFDMSTPITSSIELVIDCRKVKWNHMFINAEVPNNRSIMRMLGAYDGLSNLLDANCVVDNKTIEIDEEFTVPELPEGTYAWAESDNFYFPGDTITGSNANKIYSAMHYSDIKVTATINCLFDANGNMSASSNVLPINATYADVLQCPATDTDDELNKFGSITYAWVAIPGSKQPEISNRFSNASSITPDMIESLVDDGIADYFVFGDKPISELYDVEELRIPGTQQLELMIIQIPYTASYTITVPDEVTANMHSFQIDFDCGNHFGNDVTIDFETNTVYLPSTGYTVSFYTDAACTTPLTSLTFTEKGSKTIYVKSETEDEVARVGSDTATINFEITDLGYDEQVSSGD